ncbi:MAG: glycosyltransferase family 9 protein [Bacteroidales bacterium]|nr:glycosyltransferase family 9 protein [Bacteroidales bacterium]
MKKFLIIQTAFIGDVILATPIIEKLYNFYPNDQIDFLLRKGNESLLKDHPHVSNILIWDKKTDKTKNLFRMIKQIRETKYDYVINLQRFLSTGIITTFSKGKCKIGFDKNPLSFMFNHKVKHKIGEGNHEIERNINLISEITDNEICKPRLYPSEKDFELISQYTNEPYICIAPTSVWFTKQYPADKWIELIDSIRSEYRIYLIGGKDDRTVCDSIISDSKNTKIKNLCGELSFLQTSALMTNAVMNYVNDSAPMHMASSMNAKTTAVFCSTVPDFGFGPLSDCSKIVEIEEFLDCRPCGLHGAKKCPQGHFKCAHEIKTRQLLFE